MTTFYYEVAPEAKLVVDGEGHYHKGYVSMEIDLPPMSEEDLETISYYEVPAMIERQINLPARYLTPITKEAYDAAHEED